MTTIIDNHSTGRGCDSGVKSPAPGGTPVTPPGLTPEAALRQAHAGHGIPVRAIAAWAGVAPRTVYRAVNEGLRLDPRTVRKFATSPTAPAWVVRAMADALRPTPVPARPLAAKYRDPNGDGVSDLRDVPLVVTGLQAAEAHLGMQFVYLSSDGVFDESDRERLSPLQDDAEGWRESVRRFARYGTAAV